jgi:thiol-disulfide isomerase/thioredoxin
MFSCSTKEYSIIEEDRTKIIIGEFPREILNEFGWFNAGYKSFLINDSASFGIIKSTANRFDVIVFLGTWCPDSKEHVPRFMKIMDEAGVTGKHIKLIGLNRDKKLGMLTDKYKITKVPTFIFIKDERELGRIVEHPRTTLLKDIAGILIRIK